VHRHRGTISAEHGLGQLKVDEAAHYKSAVELKLVQAIKTALDPLNLMNPGKVLRTQPGQRGQREMSS
jgi:FAD/FMN-containing dehydrogenase